MFRFLCSPVNMLCLAVPPTYRLCQRLRFLRVPDLGCFQPMAGQRPASRVSQPRRLCVARVESCAVGVGAALDEKGIGMSRFASRARRHSDFGSRNGSFCRGILVPVSTLRVIQKSPQRGSQGLLRNQCFSDVEAIHETMINTGDGSHGLRDTALLESALA